LVLGVIVVGASLGGSDDGDSAQGGANNDSASPASSASASASASASTQGADSGETSTNENYAELYSDPDAHEGAAVNVTGQLLERPENTGDDLAFQMYANAENLEWNTIFYTHQRSLDLDTDDYVPVKGEVLGTLATPRLEGASSQVYSPLPDHSHLRISMQHRRETPATGREGAQTASSRL